MSKVYMTVTNVANITTTRGITVNEEARVKILQTVIITACMLCCLGIAYGATAPASPATTDNKTTPVVAVAVTATADLLTPSVPAGGPTVLSTKEMDNTTGEVLGADDVLYAVLISIAASAAYDILKHGVIYAYNYCVSHNVLGKLKTYVSSHWNQLSASAKVTFTVLHCH